MISVVVPTITGREHWLERCLDAYVRTREDVEIQFITMLSDP